MRASSLAADEEQKSFNAKEVQRLQSILTLKVTSFFPIMITEVNMPFLQQQRNVCGSEERRIGRYSS